MKLKLFGCALMFAALSPGAIILQLGNGSPNNVVNLVGNDIPSATQVGHVDGVPVVFTGTGITAVADGQARIEEGDVVNNAIRVEAPGYTFTGFEFNAFNGSGTLDVFANGGLVGSIDLANGENRAYLLAATEGDLIASVTLAPTQGSSYADLRQIRFEGFAPSGPGSEIPEPGTYALMGSALAGLAMLRRRQ